MTSKRAGGNTSDSFTDNVASYHFDTKKRWMFLGGITLRDNTEGEVSFSLQAGMHTCLHMLEEYAEDQSLPITMELSGFGGDIYFGMGMYDRILQTRKKGIKVHMHAYGPIFSAISLMLQAADVRLLSLQSFLMLHWYLWQEDGRYNLKGLKEKYTHALETADEVVQIYSTRAAEIPGADPKKVRRMIQGYLDSEKTLHARAAIHVGLADGIIGEWKPIIVRSGNGH